MGSNHSAQSQNTPLDMQNVVILGSSNSGKTSILERLVQNKFSGDLPTTVGLGSALATIDVDGQQVKLQVLDTSSQERFRQMVELLLVTAVGVVLVFDLTDLTTFHDISDWFYCACTHCDTSPYIILIGNKSDLQKDRTVPREEAEKFAGSHDIPYFETSARDGTNVREAFVDIARGICRMRASSQPKGSRR